MSANTDVVRGLIDAYESQDRTAAETLIAGDLAFTSPQDDHIDRATYFEKCFPHQEPLRLQEILHLVDVDAETVLIAYQYDATTGDVHRNTELHTVRDGRVHEIQVFFGGKA
jgi:ketosteroid isomerase-like protein